MLAVYHVNLEIRTSEKHGVLPSASPLHLCAHYGSAEAAVALLDAGAQVDSRDHFGRSPLHLAVIQSNGLLVRVLKSYKADLNAKDKDMRSPSYYAQSESVRFELDDPVLNPLLRVARSGEMTEGVRRALDQAIMPG